MARRLREDLLLRLLLPMATILLVSGIFSYRLAMRFADQSYDRSLLEDARALSRLVKAAGKRPLELPLGALAMLNPGEGDHAFFQIRSRSRGIVAGDGDVPSPPVQDVVEPVLYDGRLRGEVVRLVALPIPAWEPGDVGWVVVGETRRRRDSLASDIVAAIVTPQLALIVIAVIAIIGGIAAGLAPLKTLARAIQSRHQEDLAPLPDARVPGEAVPLILAFNALLSRLGEAVAAQRRFVADAAHQLRTPLAVLGVQLEQAMEETDTDAQRRLLDQLKGSLDRTARLSGQLLLLARVEPGGGRLDMEPLDLRALALEVGAHWVPRALQLGRDLGFAGSDRPVMVQGDRLMLGEMIANLLDNALHYGGSRITLQVLDGREGDGPELIVEDDGAGIPQHEWLRVFERFHRVPGTHGEGSGLGLSIVKEIVQAHGGSVWLEAASERGLRVRIRIPPLPVF